MDDILIVNIATAVSLLLLKLLLLPLLASERSERDTYRGKNEKIGDVCWRASEDSIRGG